MSLRRTCGAVALLFWSVVIVACSNAPQDNNEGPDGSAHPGSIIEVEFFTQPEQVKVGTEVELFVKVTQDGELVDDAEEVVFEIWHEDDEVSEGHSDAHEDHNNAHEDHNNEHENHDNEHEDHGDHHGMHDYDSPHEMIDAVHVGDGQYSLSYTFAEEGLYYVMYHVTARGFHAMTPQEVPVSAP